LAAELAQRVDDEPALHRIAPVHFALVCFRHRDGDAATDSLAAAINADPSLYVTPTHVDGHRVIRVAIGQTWTTSADVERLWEVVEGALGKSPSGSGPPSSSS
jgi:glutamate/tyrosine decarboxylase-like PLP-dependent enzyme